MTLQQHNRISAHINRVEVQWGQKTDRGHLHSHPNGDFVQRRQIDECTHTGQKHNSENKT